MIFGTVSSTDYMVYYTNQVDFLTPNIITGRILRTFMLFIKYLTDNRDRSTRPKIYLTTLFLKKKKKHNEVIARVFCFGFRL